MALRVQCGCGKSFQVVDALAGKNARCPACSTMVSVPGGNGTAGAGGGGAAVAAPAKAKSAGTRYNPATAAARRPVEKTPAIALSPRAILFFGLLVGVPLLIFLGKVGPVKAMSQWQELEPKLNNYTADVVFTICMEQYKDVQFDEFMRPPQVTNVMIDGPVMMLMLPSEIPVQGTSTEGRFKGTYFTGDKRFEMEIGVSHDSRVIAVKAHVDDKGQVVIDEQK